MYPRIPEFPNSAEPETAFERGARALRWVIETGAAVALSTVDLERVDVAAGYAIIGAADDDMRQRLSSVRHSVLATLRIRRTLESGPAPQRDACTADQRPNLGPMAPLRPGPVTRPPSPAEADINF